MSYTKGMENQIKSRFYYLFWGVMAIAVVGGQLYVGSGYREMAREQRAFAQSVYDAQMSAATMIAPRKYNRTGEFE